MVKRRLVAGLGIGLAASLALSGCSGAADDGSVQLQMVESLTNPARTELLEELIAEFEDENPGITVELVSPPTDQADQKIQQMLQAGSGIDVLEVRDLTVGPFSTNGWLADMSGEFEGWAGWDALTDNAKNAAMGNGATYFIPYGFYGISLFYRTDLVEEAGFDGAPVSWEDLLEQASAIQDPDANTYGYAFRGGTNGHTNVALVITAYLADRLDVENAFQLQNGDTIFSAPEALDALELYLQLFEQASPPSSVAWGYPEMVEGFTNGSTAFLLQDPEVIAAVEQASAIGPDQWNTAPMPTGPGGQAIQPLATAGWGTAASSEHPEEAAKLIKFLSEGDASIRFTQGNSLIPILLDADQDPFYKTGPWESYLYMNEHPETYITAVQPRGVPWWSEWGEKADAELQKMLIGQLTPEALLASWDEYWTEKWAAE